MNPRPLVIAIVLSFIGLALAYHVSPILPLLIWGGCVIMVFIGGLLLDIPTDPDWAKEPEWFNCDCCDRSFTSDGRIETFTPRICAPMDTCPRCLAVNKKAMEGVTNFVKPEITKRN